MKKTLLMTAAALAAGLISSQAQSNVYSANVVGYVNLVVNNGYNAFTVPLDYDGSGTNNTVNSVLGTNLPPNSQVLTWSGSGFIPDTFTKPRTGSPFWSSPNETINPGQGIFIYNPGDAVTLTVVGDVLQGGLTNSYVSGAGYSFVGSQFPVAGGITSTFGYVPSPNDQVLSWTGSGYSPNTYTKPRTGSPFWSGGEPQISVGQGVFLVTTNQNPVWGTNFMVQ